jgi:hypothetical protein
MEDADAFCAVQCVFYRSIPVSNAVRDIYHLCVFFLHFPVEVEGTDKCTIAIGQAHSRLYDFVHVS